MNRAFLSGIVCKKISDTETMFLFTLRTSFFYKNKFYSDFVKCALLKSYFKSSNPKLPFTVGDQLFIEGSLKCFSDKEKKGEMFVRVTLFSIELKKDDIALLKSLKTGKKNLQDKDL